MEAFQKDALSAETLEFSDYRNLAGELERCYADTIPEKSALRIALLSSFTSSGLEDVLRVKCCRAGIWPEIYIGGYNQYFQEILNPNSPLYAFNPDMVFLFIDTATLLGDLALNPYSLTDQERRDWAQSKVAEMQSLMLQLKQASGALIVLHGFELPSYSPAGILEAKKEFGHVEALEWINAQLRAFCKTDSRLHFLDTNAFCAEIGKANVRDEKMYYLGDIRLAWQNMPALCDKYMSYIKPQAALSRKCIVLDLDNTLWGGVIGEDGINGIQLGPTAGGRSYWEFQKALLALFQRGIVLAVNSKNNFEDAMEVLRDHPYMILREEHFAALRINWDDKVSNLKSLAEELNLGLDSFVFFDDDQVQRGMVRSLMPEVLVVDMPEDPALYLKTLQGLNDFNTFQLTEEDLLRGRLYAQERQRRTFQQESGGGLESYLEGLGTVVTVEAAGVFALPRVAQLTQRTNQFNMTTRRYSEDEIICLAQSGNFLVLALSAKDRFGDNGISGAAIIEKQAAQTWRIDTLLMSCRILGRQIEEAFLAKILQLAKDENTRRVTAEFIPTQKNKISAGFYEKNGFRPLSSQGDVLIFEFDLNMNFSFPKSIQWAVSKSGRNA